MASNDTAMAVLAAKTGKAAMGAKIMSGTLDTLSKTVPAKGKGRDGSGDTAAGYDFNKEVLSSVYGAKGAIASLKS